MSSRPSSATSNAAKAQLAKLRVATSPNKKASLVVGQIRVQQLAKLASAKGGWTVQPVELKQTGAPSAAPIPTSSGTSRTRR